MHRRPLVLDLVAEAREPLGAAVEDPVDDVRHVSFPVAKLGVLAGGYLEIGDRLTAEPGPDRALGRDGLGLVDAAANEVEERRRELVRPRLASLPEERRHECGLGLRRRLLLVLAVVPGLALASQEPEHEPDEEERGDRGDRERNEERPQRMRLERVDPLAVSFVAVGVGLLLRDDAVERVPALDLHAGRRGERPPRDQRP